jgi:hypothetical protein
MGFWVPDALWTHLDRPAIIAESGEKLFALVLSGCKIVSGKLNVEVQFFDVVYEVFVAVFVVLYFFEDFFPSRCSSMY